MLTWNIPSYTLPSHCNLSNNVASYELFYEVYTSIGVNKYFLPSQLASWSMQYDIIYHPFPITVLNIWCCGGGGGGDSPAIVSGKWQLLNREGFGKFGPV